MILGHHQFDIAMFAVLAMVAALMLLRWLQLASSLPTPRPRVATAVLADTGAILVAALGMLAISAMLEFRGIDFSLTWAPLVRKVVGAALLGSLIVKFIWYEGRT